MMLGRSTRSKLDVGDSPQDCGAAAAVDADPSSTRGERSTATFSLRTLASEPSDKRELRSGRRSGGGVDAQRSG